MESSRDFAIVARAAFHCCPPTPPLLAIVATLVLAAMSHAQDIHMLVVADTADPRSNAGSSVTVERINGAFRYLVPDGQYTLDVLESAKTRFTKDVILNRIAQVAVARDDTFVFLYHGHGARDGDRHFLNMPDGGRLYSRDLQGAVQAKRCRLRIILTSSCNVPVERAPILPKILPKAEEIWDVESQGIAPVMEELFINHTGLLHMNSAWQGLLSFTDSRKGSWFFDELLNYCTSVPTGRPTWWCVDRMLGRRLGARFKETFGKDGYKQEGTGDVQRELFAVTWSLRESKSPKGRPTSRFGVAGDDSFTSTGVTVVEVHPAGPGEKIAILDEAPQRLPNEQPAVQGQPQRTVTRLRKGDVILAISGEEIKDEDSYIELVRSSPREMHFRFQRNGKTYEAKTNLRW